MGTSFIEGGSGTIEGVLTVVKVIMKFFPSAATTGFQLFVHLFRFHLEVFPFVFRRTGCFNVLCSTFP